MIVGVAKVDRRTDHAPARRLDRGGRSRSSGAAAAAPARGTSTRPSPTRVRRACHRTEATASKNAATTRNQRLFGRRDDHKCSSSGTTPRSPAVAGRRKTDGASRPRPCPRSRSHRGTTGVVQQDGRRRILRRIGGRRADSHRRRRQTRLRGHGRSSLCVVSAGDASSISGSIPETGATPPCGGDSAPRRCWRISEGGDEARLPHPHGRAERVAGLPVLARGHEGDMGPDTSVFARSSLHQWKCCLAAFLIAVPGRQRSVR
jgi:hypothetical protein